MLLVLLLRQWVEIRRDDGWATTGEHEKVAEGPGVPAMIRCWWWQVVLKSVKARAPRTEIKTQSSAVLIATTEESEVRRPMPSVRVVPSRVVLEVLGTSRFHCFSSPHLIENKLPSLQISGRYHLPTVTVLQVNSVVRFRAGMQFMHHDKSLQR